MSELAAILARRRAKDGTGEEPKVETPATPVINTKPSPPKAFSFKQNSPPASTPSTESFDNGNNESQNTSAAIEDQPSRKTSSKIAALQGSLGALNVNAFRPPAARKSNTVSATITGDDYDYESTMKTGSSMPGMVGIPMIGLAKSGFALPGMLKKNESPYESSTAPEPEPAVVSHATMSRATGPKRRAPTKQKTNNPPVDTTEPISLFSASNDTPTATPSTPTEPEVAFQPAADTEQVKAQDLPRKPSMGLFGALPTQPPPSTSVGESSSERRSSGGTSFIGSTLTSTEPAIPNLEKQASGGVTPQKSPSTRAPVGGVSLFGMAAPPVVTIGKSSSLDDGVTSTSLFGDDADRPRPPSTKSLFEPVSPPKPSAIPTPPAKLQLFAQDDEGESSDEWDDEDGKPNALFGGAASKQTVVTPSPAVQVTKPAPSAPNQAKSLFGGDDSDDSDDDAEGLFGTGLPKK